MQSKITHRAPISTPGSARVWLLEYDCLCSCVIAWVWLPLLMCDCLSMTASAHVWLLEYDCRCSCVIAWVWLPLLMCDCLSMTASAHVWLLEYDCRCSCVTAWVWLPLLVCDCLSMTASAHVYCLRIIIVPAVCKTCSNINATAVVEILCLLTVHLHTIFYFRWKGKAIFKERKLILKVRSCWNGSVKPGQCIVRVLAKAIYCGTAPLSSFTVPVQNR